MLVSWKWLAKYIELSMDREALEQRLSLTGLNHEETNRVGDDFVIDLEVTSNRGDCLGHLGVAREIGVLYALPVNKPQPKLVTSGVSVNSLLAVENRFLDACPRYTARVIQGVQVGPSPAWMVEALAAVGMATVNNVVDATNFVMMECGQPLHAFDLAKVGGSQIIIRPAGKGEKMEAIDHRTYELDESMCVIADAQSASAVAGVMGGASSEVEDTTRDLVIEAAVFTPLSIRRTARRLKLHSPSSYRFERRVDPAGVDWASRRVCQLIVELAGGKVAQGVIDTSPEVPTCEPIELRSHQVERILGIRIDPREVSRILTSLGCQEPSPATFVPPSWRHDLTREADLIEEVARIHGYEKIPEDSPIPVAPSAKRRFDSALQRVRSVLTSAGLSEAMTPSVVTQKIDQTLSPWTHRDALCTETAMLEGARTLRRSLLPSLLQGRAHNWAAASVNADLFEVAHIYLPDASADALPCEQYTLGMVQGGDFFQLKGVLETLLQRLGVATKLSVQSIDCDGFASSAAVRLQLGDELLGYLGVVDPGVVKQWKLPGHVMAAEISLPVMMEHAQLVPQQQRVSAFPSIERDLNFVVDEQIRWSELEQVVRGAIGEELASVYYRETYRDAAKDGTDRKRVLLTVELQRHDSTLSGEQADVLIGHLISQCKTTLNADLLS